MNNKLKQFIFSISSKFITFSALFVYAKIIDKKFIAEIALIQAYVVVFVLVFSLQIPASIFRLSIIKKYKNFASWIIVKSDLLIWLSVIIFFLNKFEYNFFIVVVFLSLSQISVLNKLEFIRSNLNQINYFQLLFVQVFFSFSFTILVFLLFSEYFNPLSIFITFEYLSWILIFLISNKKINHIKKDYNLISKFNKKDFFVFLKYGILLIPTCLAWSGILFGPIILIDFFFDKKLVGNFAISNRIPSIIFILSTLILGIVGKDLILSYQKNRIKYYNNFFKKLFIWFICSLTFGVLLYFVNLNFLKKYFLNYKLDDSIIFLQFLNTILLSNFSFLGFFYQTTINLKPNAITSFITFLFCLFLSIFFMKISFSLTGLMTGIVIGIIIGIILRIINITSIIYDAKIKK